MAQRKSNNRSKPAKGGPKKAKRSQIVRNTNPKIKAPKEKGPTKSLQRLLVYGRFEGLQFVFRDHVWFESTKLLFLTEPAVECEKCGAVVLSPGDFIKPCSGKKKAEAPV